MKIVLIGLSIVSFLFSTNSLNSLDNVNDAVCIEDNTEEIVATATCFREIGGITYIAHAGNFLSTEEGAARRCEAKLDQIQ